MADLATLQSALVKADAAGDTAGAKVLAGEIMRLRGAATESQPEAKPDIANPFGEMTNALARNFTFGLSDKAAAAGTAVGKVLKGDGDFSDAYHQALGDIRSRGEQFKEESPVLYQAGAVPGFIGSMASAGGSVPATLKGKMVQGAKVGGQVGALNAYGANNDESLADTARDVAIGGAGGAAIGAAAPVVVEGVKAAAKPISSLIEPLTESGRANILKRYQEGLINDPDAKQKVIAALQGAKPLVPGSNPTAGEAISDIPEATGLAAHQKIIAKTPGVSGQFAARDAEQEAARRAAIRTVGQTPADLETAIAARSDATTPLRETALENANIAGVKVPALTERLANRSQSVADALQQKGQLETLAAQQRNRADFYSNYPTAAAVSPRAPAGQFAQNADDATTAARTATEVLGNRKAERDITKYMLDSLAAHGLKPLDAGAVVKQIDAVASTPGLRASDVVSKSLGDVRDKIASLADRNGFIDANDLYMIRKELGNTIAKYAAENKNFDQRLTSGLQKQIQGYIDDAIEGAGGAGWKEYLTRYADMSKPINEMQIGQYLENKLTNPLETGERAASFAQAVRDAPGTIKRSTGGPRFTELGQVLSPQNEQIVNAIMADLQRKSAFNRLASGTNLPGGSNLREAADLKLPNMLSRPAMIANFVMRHIGQGADQKINAMAAKQYLDPQLLADSLSRVPSGQKEKVIGALLQRLATMGGTSAAAQGE